MSTPEPLPTSAPADPSRAIKTAVAALSEELVAFRRDLHRHPELAWDETRTTEKVSERLAPAMTSAPSSATSL